ncbi:MAG: PIN domain-containing protein [Caldilineales bacterium]
MRKGSAWQSFCRAWRKSAVWCDRKAKTGVRRIFVDANILIAGADSQSGASNALLRIAEVGLFQLVVCTQVLDEAERNLRRKLPRALPNFAMQMARLRLEILPDPVPEDVRPWEQIIEAKDAPILCAAVASGVDRFVTLNTRDFTPNVAEQSGLVIQTPAEFMEDLRQLVTENLA